MLEVSFDGKTFQRRLVDPCCTYYRLSSIGIVSNLNPEKIHTMKIRLLDEKPDKRSIPFERNRPDFDKNPANTSRSTPISARFCWSATSWRSEFYDSQRWIGRIW